ncbi:MAG TPA: hypothetical protein PKM25_05860 [Candidatus Ozemobacteraceae bacterium]|nr:hypothetical protein [Candidatus Ozemobacteraceae bacterium]
MAKHVTAKELEQQLNIAERQRKRLLAAGAPKVVSGKGYDLAAWVSWILAQPVRRSDSKARAAAEMLHAKVIGCKSSDQAPTRPAKRQARGLEAGVKRLRDAEEKLHRKWCDAVDASDPTARGCFQDWQDALELLAKAEQSLVKYLKETGVLTETAKFKTFMKQNIEMAKSILLDIPGRVSPQCEGLPWHQIQKLLEPEIRRALEKLAAMP